MCSACDWWCLQYQAEDFDVAEQDENFAGCEEK